MVGILLSYWGGLFSGATLVSGRVIYGEQPHIQSQKNHNEGFTSDSERMHLLEAGHMQVIETCPNKTRLNLFRILKNKSLNLNKKTHGC